MCVIKPKPFSIEKTSCKIHYDRKRTFFDWKEYLITSSEGRFYSDTNGHYTPYRVIEVREWTQKRLLRELRSRTVIVSYRHRHGPSGFEGWCVRVLTWEHQGTGREPQDSNGSPRSLRSPSMSPTHSWILLSQTKPPKWTLKLIFSPRWQIKS